MPALTTGLGAQAGSANETTYGTYKAPDHWLEFQQEGMGLSRAFIISQALRAGRMYPNATRRTATTRSAGGSIDFEVPNQGFHFWVNLLHGLTVTPTQEATSGIYKGVHKIGTTDPFTKSCSLQVGTPETSGTVDAYSYVGTICTALELSFQTGSLIMAKATLDSQDEETGQALGTAAYPTGLESFNQTQVEVKVGGAVVEEVRGVTFTMNGPRDTSRFYLGATKKKVPLTNAYNGASCALTADYGGKTLYKAFAEAEIKSLEIIVKGAVKSTSKNEIKIACEAVGFEDGASPSVSGPGIVSQNVPITILDGGTLAPVEVTILSPDTAV